MEKAALKGLSTMQDHFALVSLLVIFLAISVLMVFRLVKTKLHPNEAYGAKDFPSAADQLDCGIHTIYPGDASENLTSPQALPSLLARMRLLQKPPNLSLSLKRRRATLEVCNVRIRRHIGRVNLSEAGTEHFFSSTDSS